MNIYRLFAVILFSALLAVPSVAQVTEEDIFQIDEYLRYAAPVAERAEVEAAETKNAQLLATLSGTVTQVIPYGETPHGIRVDVSFEGHLSGMINGSMKGIDYTLVRSDGVLEIDVRASIVTDDGALISVQINGNMIEGRIRDTSVKMVTGHPSYQWLHDKLIVGKGWAFGDQLNVHYFIDL